MKPLCSLCKVVLMEEDQKAGEMECPNCHAVYYLDKEIIEYEEDDFSSSHSDELPELGGISGGGPGIMAATDEGDAPLTDQLYRSWRHRPSDGSGASSWDSDY